MTATAFALEPALDFFDDADHLAPPRPELRLLQGQGQGGRAPFGIIVESTAARRQVEVIRRRRFLALVGLTIAVLIFTQVAGISLFSLGSTAAPGTAAPADTQTSSVVHVVRPGDSYGAIATLLGADKPNVVASQLQAANGGAELEVGQRLVVDLRALDLAAG